MPIRNDGDECGEDDFFMTELGHLKLLAVADGVGSWNVHGINPKHFVREFMSIMAEKYRGLDYLTAREHDLHTNTLLYNIIFDTMNIIIRKSITFGNVNFGSCTLAALSINLQNLHLNTYLMGDAGFMIIRDGEIAYRSVDMLKGFNFPYQLGKNKHLNQLNFMLINCIGIVDTSDHPIDGINKIFKLKVEDIIIIGSDGLFDNLFDDKILSIVNNKVLFLDRINRTGYTQVTRDIVKNLTVEAKKMGEKIEGVWTPFSYAVAMEYQAWFPAGKNDDTTLIVAIITDE